MKFEELPDIKDISQSNCLNLDERTAVEHFLGKTISEAERLFAESSLNYGEDLVYMSETAFKFYFKALENYIRSDMSTGDYSAIYALDTIINTKAEIRQEYWIWNYVSDCVGYCIKSLDRFDLKNEFQERRGKLIYYQLKYERS